MELGSPCMGSRAKSSRVSGDSPPETEAFLCMCNTILSIFAVICRFGSSHVTPYVIFWFLVVSAMSPGVLGG